MKSKKEPLTCHDCGLEAIDKCEGGQRHLSSRPEDYPCRYCERNREKDEPVFDFFSETWTLEQHTDGKFYPLIEDPDPHERLLLRVMAHCKEVYGR